MNASTPPTTPVTASIAAPRPSASARSTPSPTTAITNGSTIRSCSAAYVPQPPGPGDQPTLTESCAVLPYDDANCSIGSPVMTQLAMTHATKATASGSPITTASAT